MADCDEEKASSLLPEQHDDIHNRSVEMEFKVADYNDELLPGWRLATVSDAETSLEIVKSELCGMTFNICSLADGTVGGPGHGYQITNKIDSIHDHKLLIFDTSLPSSIKTEENVSEVKAINKDDEDSNLIESPPSEINRDTAETTFQSITIPIAMELPCETISTQGNNIPAETNVLQQNTNEILTQQTNGSIQVSIPYIQNDIENSGSKEELYVSNSNIDIVSEKIECDDIKTVEQIDGEINPAGSLPAHSQKGEAVETNNTHAGSGSAPNEPQGSVVDATNLTVHPASATKPVVTDSEDSKSTNSSPGTKKRKPKPMSASMQRLTAKKESPESKRNTDLLSATERKAKADELRKKKISEQRAKDDERRAAVLERKKKLEDAERAKKEALFKRLTTKDTELPGDKQIGLKKRYSSSTSNLSQLRKSKTVDLNSTTVPKRTEYKPKEKPKTGERPRSVMQRASLGAASQKTNGTDAKKAPDVRRPMTALGVRTSTANKSQKTKPPAGPPPTRQSLLNPRPATALGVTGADRRKTLPKQPRTSAIEKPATNTMKMQKSKSATGLLSRDRSTNKEGTKPTSLKKEATNNTEKKTDTKQNKAVSPPKKDVPKDLVEKKKEKLKPPLKASTPKEKKNSVNDNKTTEPSKKKPTSKASTSKKNDKEEKVGMTEEEAKKALAEHRKKAKEEAEAKARADREKDEEERKRREEEEKRLAEQLKLEEEKHDALLELLKTEEEERRQKLMDEKEQRERGEKERLESEQREREEEIERKAKLELDRIQKEQEKQDLVLEQERIGRKKRVEMIMARVSSKRSQGGEEDSLSSTPPIETASPEVSSACARLKVDDILRSRGFGRSTEDISSIIDKHEDGSQVKLDDFQDNSSSENDITETCTENEQLNTADENPSSIVDYPITNENQVKLLSCVVFDSPLQDNIPSDESPPLTAENSLQGNLLSDDNSVSVPVSDENSVSVPDENSVSVSVSLDEAPAAGVDIDQHITDASSSLKVEETANGNLETELNANDQNEVKSDNISKQINYELPSGDIDTINLSLDGDSNGQVNNHATLNDTNNNKDFLIEDRSVPIVAWNDNAPSNESNGNIQKYDTEGDAQIYLNGNQDGKKLFNGSADVHIIADTSLLAKPDETCSESEGDQWNKFDDRMKQIQPPVDQVAGNEENKLWKVLEGKVELSECF